MWLHASLAVSSRATCTDTHQKQCQRKWRFALSLHPCQLAKSAQADAVDSWLQSSRTGLLVKALAGK